MDNKLKFAIVSNIIFEPYLKNSLKSILDADITLLNIPLAELFDDNHLKDLSEVDYILVNINIAEMFPNLLDQLRTGELIKDDVLSLVDFKCKKISEYISNNTSAHIFWSLFEDYEYQDRKLFGAISYNDGIVIQMNKRLLDIKTDNITFIDMGYIIASVGIDKAYDIRGKYRWNAPYSKDLIERWISEIFRQIQTINGKTKKCIVVDCDNVLWGGILSEDGIEDIRLDVSGFGKEYHVFQQYLKLLYDYGVILAVCSKNDSEDVLKVFREHNAMILKEENIACFKVNWQDKVQNIKDISEELNIGLESIVFVDDSYFEINAVKSILPDVSTVLYNKKTIAFDLSKYVLLNEQRTYENSMLRQNTYYTNHIRNELQLKSISFDDYLLSLEMKIDIHIADISEYNRISELSQRANKCTNGVRFSTDQLKKLVQNGGELFAVYVRDKFSDLGLVGAIAIKNKMIKLFVLSCRAIGRRVEDRMVDFIVRNQLAQEIYLFSNYVK